MGKREFVLKFNYDKPTLSDLKQRSNNSCWKCSRWPQSLGIGSFWGSYSVKYAYSWTQDLHIQLHSHTATHHTIIYLLPIITLSCKLYSQMLKPTIALITSIIHSIFIPREFIQTAYLIPWLLRQPFTRITMWIVQSNAPSEQEPPFIFLYLLLVLEQVNTQQEWEEQLSIITLHDR